MGGVLVRGEAGNEETGDERQNTEVERKGNTSQGERMGFDRFAGHWGGGGGEIDE